MVRISTLLVVVKLSKATQGCNIKGPGAFVAHKPEAFVELDGCAQDKKC